MSEATSIWSDARMTPGNTDEKESSDGHRTKFEQDHDRILFSTPVRRLSDKTQVFPLDQNDGVRTRLTHSHEVANLARSIGARAGRRQADAFDGQDIASVVQPILGAIGLAHDLGNPPFGHQGEAGIAKWFSDREDWIFDRRSETQRKTHVDGVRANLRTEFTSFDGNPQTIRLLTRLQTSQGKAGLNLTATTIIALLKYPVCASHVVKRNLVRKKCGYFDSEAHIIEWARAQTGLREGQRHPLTWIMEAADDIAYSVLDVEDAMKKGIVSPEDLHNILECNKNECGSKIYNELASDFSRADASGRPPAIIRDIKIGYARARLIAELIEHATLKYIEQLPSIRDYSCEIPLMETSALCNRLKKIALEYAFGNTEVLFVEAKGRRAIEELLSAFWYAIITRDNRDNIASRRSDALSRYVYSLFSSNYLEAATDPEQSGKSEISGRLRYRELRLLTDMISGMTDGFALKAAEKIAHLR
jgi:dGTPase